MASDFYKRDITAAHAIITKRFCPSLMASFKLLFGEKGFCVDGDERRRRGGAILEVGHPESSGAGIGRVLNKVPEVAFCPRGVSRRLEEVVGR